MDNSVSFKARINIDRMKLKEGFIFDRQFSNRAYKQDLKKTIKQVEELAKMKEKSVVDITPRLDNNQLNLITRVHSKDNTISTIINERSARKMTSDENFAQRFVRNVANTIKNVDIASKGLKEIRKTIKGSKTLEDSGFAAALPYYMINSLNSGNNPTKRIISVLKKIEKEYPKEKNIISIKNEHHYNDKTRRSYTSSYFVLANSKGEKKIPMSSLLKDPSQNLFA